MYIIIYKWFIPKPNMDIRFSVDSKICETVEKQRTKMTSQTGTATSYASKTPFLIDDILHQSKGNSSVKSINNNNLICNNNSEARQAHDIIHKSSRSNSDVIASGIYASEEDYRKMLQNDRQVTQYFSSSIEVLTN